MRITQLIPVASLSAVLTLGALTAQAKEHRHGQATPQTHHCQLADGSTDTSKTHKQCTAAKGSWARNTATAAAAPTPAATATPAASATPSKP